MTFNSNGTISNSTYYLKKQKSLSFIHIGSLKEQTKKAFGEMFTDTEVTIQKILLFQPKTWLATESIEWVSAIWWCRLMKSYSSKRLKNVRILSPNVGQYLLLPTNIRSIEPTFYNNLPLESECWLIPFNIKGNHWVLAIVDFDKGTFSYIDPFGNTQQETQHYINTFQLFLANMRFWAGETLPDDRKTVQKNILQLKCFKFTAVQMQYEKQQKSDFSNCGIYVLAYIDLYLKTKNIIGNINIEKIREDCIKEIIASVSVDVCLYCCSEKNLNNLNKTTTCFTCKRFICKVCEKKADLFRTEMTSMFICILCRVNEKENKL